MRWQWSVGWSALAAAGLGSAEWCADSSDEDTEAAVSLAQLRGKQTRVSEPDFELPEWHDPMEGGGGGAALRDAAPEEESWAARGGRGRHAPDEDSDLGRHRAAVSGRDAARSSSYVEDPRVEATHAPRRHHRQQHRHTTEDDAEASFQRRVSELQELRQRDQEAFDVGSKSWNPVNSIVGDDRDALKQYAQAQHEISEAISSWEHPTHRPVAASRKDDQVPSITQVQAVAMTPREQLALDMIVFLQDSTGHSLHDLATKAILSVEISVIVFLIIRGYRDAIWAPPYNIVFGLVVLAAMVTSLFELDVNSLLPVVIWVVSWALFFWLWCHAARPIRRLATRLSGYEEVKG
mmetsp:Transcript_10706/g.25491  ORF Transcript_10706/g.25491 Transcript_10706/m.25491 type:complete len:350 (+) Transcript_10706:128-1177(+)